MKTQKPPKRVARTHAEVVSCSALRDYLQRLSQAAYEEDARKGKFVHRRVRLGPMRVAAMARGLRSAGIRVTQSTLSRALTGATLAVSGAVYVALERAPMAVLTSDEIEAGKLSEWRALLDKALRKPEEEWFLPWDSGTPRELSDKERSSLVKALSAHRRAKGHFTVEAKDRFDLDDAGPVRLPNDLLGVADKDLRYFEPTTLPCAVDVLLGIHSTGSRYVGEEGREAHATAYDYAFAAEWRAVKVRP